VSRTICNGKRRLTLEPWCQKYTAKTFRRVTQIQVTRQQIRLQVNKIVDEPAAMSTVYCQMLRKSLHKSLKIMLDNGFPREHSRRISQALDAPTRC
jgi:hypothetical protein